jgi:hypothetical protein
MLFVDRKIIFSRFPWYSLPETGATGGKLRHSVGKNTLKGPLTI